MKKQHRFRITVEHMQALREGELMQEPLVFDAGNHDNIIDLARRVAARGTYSADDAAALMSASNCSANWCSRTRTTSCCKR